MPSIFEKAKTAMIKPKTLDEIVQLEKGSNGSESVRSDHELPQERHSFLMSGNASGTEWKVVSIPLTNQLAQRNSLLVAPIGPTEIAILGGNKYGHMTGDGTILYT